MLWGEVGCVGPLLSMQFCFPTSSLHFDHFQRLLVKIKVIFLSGMTVIVQICQ